MTYLKDNVSFTKEDEEYMKRAIELAKKGTGFVNPNPLVGAVIVKDDRIIGEGYHHKYGEAHAERDALANCHESPKGATIYVTLEPCCHHGKQPPCTEAILEAGISRVVVGSMDPNPLVSGKGVSYLEQHGIRVDGLLLNQECLNINKVFFHYIKDKKPYVIMKYAQTLDGKIATESGLSKWITGEKARERVHQDRHRYSAIMVGVGTVLLDDPMLNCRLSEIEPSHPTRIICDSHLRTPLDSKIVQTADTIRTIIATTSDDEARKEEYLKCGVEIITTECDENKCVDLNELMQCLGQLGIDSVILEGGGTLNWSAMSSGIVDEVQAYIAPKIFGGDKAKTPVGGKGVKAPDDAFKLKNTRITQLGEDILVEGEL